MNFSDGFVSGGIAAMAGATVACPFDVIKTRLQSTYTYQTPCRQKREFHHGGGALQRDRIGREFRSFTKFLQLCNTECVKCVSLSGNVSHNCRREMMTIHAPRGAFYIDPAHLNNKNFNLTKVWNMLRSSVHNEGVTFLFKGLIPSLAAVVPAKALYFGFYTTLKDFYSPIFRLETNSNVLCSSLTAGFIQSSLISPIFMIRTRLQLSTQKVSIFGVTQEIYATHGLKGFFRGLSATYLGLSEVVIHFLIYEKMKIYLKKCNYMNDEITTQNSAFVGACAILSRMVATTCAYPHDVVRTRMRQADANYASLTHCVQSIYRSEHLAGFYRGLEVELMKKIPNVAVVFIVYEAIMSYISTTSKLSN